MPVCYYFWLIKAQHSLNLILESARSTPTPTSGAHDAQPALDPREYPRDYPRERIPKQPVLSLATFTPCSGLDIPSVLDAGAVRYVNRGCMALGLALQHAQVGDGDAVLLPAYHCISMVEPVIWRGAQPLFYRVQADTSIDLSDIEAKITPHTRALLVAHYFGFPQDMVRIRAFCDAHRLLLIEDCAHAFFGSIAGAPFGSFGDYAIASAWKFFPTDDGGLLSSTRKDLSSIALQAPSLRFQAKAVVNALEQAFEYRRLPIARVLFKVPLLLKDLALRLIKRKVPITPQTNTAPTTTIDNWGFDPAWVRQRMSAYAKAVTRLASKHRVTQKRRSNYARLLAEFSATPGCRPLFATLPEGVVPHVFPLLIDEPERIFNVLKRQGVPIIRFGEFPWPAMPQTVCAVSSDFSRRVFQFPCHQDLMPEELEWMMGCIHKALSTQARST